MGDLPREIWPILVDAIVDNAARAITTTRSVGPPVADNADGDTVAESGSHVSEPRS